MNVALVACCSKKLDRPAAARDLYVSALFTKAAAYARTFDAWYILSAKYGLVAPDEVIEPYDCTLLKTGREERRAWGQKVFDQMRAAGIDQATLTALAGARYVQPLVWAGLTLVTPLEGLRIGEQLAWLSRR